MLDGAFKSWPCQCGKEATELLDLLLVHGAEPGLVNTKIAGLSSLPPPPITLATGALQSFAALVRGSIFVLRADVQGRGWNFLRADHRCAARRQLYREGPYLVVGATLSRNLRTPGMEPTTMKKRRVERTHHHATKTPSEHHSRKPNTSNGYFFMKQHPAATHRPVVGQSVTCIAVKENRHQNIMGSVFLKTGIEELWAIERVTQFFDSLGDRDITLKSDTEPAIVAFRNRVAGGCKAELASEDAVKETNEQLVSLRTP